MRSRLERSSPCSGYALDEFSIIEIFWRMLWDYWIRSNISCVPWMSDLAVAVAVTDRVALASSERSDSSPV
jgi:hypothetical protein